MQILSHIGSGDGSGSRDLRLIERPHVHVAFAGPSCASDVAQPCCSQVETRRAARMRTIASCCCSPPLIEQPIDRGVFVEWEKSRRRDPDSLCSLHRRPRRAPDSLRPTLSHRPLVLAVRNRPEGATVVSNSIRPNRCRESGWLPPDGISPMMVFISVVFSNAITADHGQ